MKGLKEMILLGLGLVGFMVLGPFAIIPAIAGLVFISRMGTAYHTANETEIEDEVASPAIADLGFISRMGTAYHTAKETEVEGGVAPTIS